MSETSTPLPDAHPNRAHGLVTALGIGQVCSWGSLYYSFPLIAEAMSAELGWSKPSLYGAATLGLIATAATAYPAGTAIDRGHGRWLMTVASLLAGCFLLLWSQITTLGMFYLAVTAIGVLQAATLYEPAFAVVVRRLGPVDARAGITTLTLWGGFASTIFIPLVQWLLDQWGWREALMVLAAINGLLCASLYFTFIQPARDIVDGSVTGRQAQREQNKLAVRHTLRQPVFWALLAALFSYATMFSAFTYHMYPLLLERGLDTTSVVKAIALIGPAQVAGRLVLTVFASRVPVRIVGLLIAALFPLTFAALLLDLSFHAIAVVCIIYGSINGIFTIVRGMLVPEMLSRHAYGAINGLLSGPVFTAKAVAPLGAAALWSVNQSYGLVLYAIVLGACMLALSFGLAAWLSRHGPSDDVPALASRREPC